MSIPTTVAKPAQLPTPRPGETQAAIAAAPAPASAPATSAGQAPVVVRVQDLGKRFKIFAKPLDRLREWLRLGGPGHTEFWALRGVSFEVRRGECLGIIGANGSGKSTLLKMITGAMVPTEGTYHVQGRVLSLIELGTGLNPHLTGRANIIHSAALLGFPSDFARQKMPEIEAFAELGEFFDRQVNLYSSGMRVRLAFSMFACFRPEVFIVDEALSVGDVFFQQKCTTRLRELLEDGMTMIFVSHDQSAVLNLCDTGILLQRGRQIYMGTPPEVVNRYAASMNLRPRAGPRRQHGRAAPNTAPGASGVAAPGKPPPAAAEQTWADRILSHDLIGPPDDSRPGNGDMRIIAARVVDKAGRPMMQAMLGDPLAFEVLIEARRDVHQPRAGLHLFDRFNNLVFASGTYQQGQVIPDLHAGDRAIVRLEVTMDVQPGEYTFGLGASLPSEDNPEHGVVCDKVTPLGPILVLHNRQAVRPFFGMARLPMKISLQAPATPTTPPHP